MLNQRAIQRAKDRLEYLSNLPLVEGPNVKKVKVDKNDALVKRFMSIAER